MGQLLLRRFDEAHQVMTSVFADLLTTGVASPSELIDAVGVEALERYLPSVLRVRLMRMALQEGRAGRPFDDEVLLNTISPAMLTIHLPLSVLRVAIEKLCPEASAETSVPPDEHPLDESDEVTVSIDASQTEALLAGMPDLTLPHDDR